MYRELAKKSTVSEEKRKVAGLFDPMQQGFSNAFAKKPPDFTKLNEMMLEYEYDHL